MPGPCILVIDDSATILKVVKLVLSKSGYTVHTALDGEEGLKLAVEVQPDLILLDFVMPKMNGYQVCRALADSRELSGVPVVLMSGKGDQVGERFVKVMGIVDYITKPFSPEALQAVVEHILEKYGTRQSGSLPDHETPVPLTQTMARVAALRRASPIAQESSIGGGGVAAVVGGAAADSGESRPGVTRGVSGTDGTTDPALRAGMSGEVMIVDAGQIVDEEDDDGGESHEVTDVRRQSRRRAGPVEEAARKRGIEALREAVAEAVGADELLGEDVADRVREKLSDEVLDNLLAVLPFGEARAPSGSGASSGDDEIILSGNLARVPIAEVLALLEQQRQTGVLTVERGPASVEIWFRSGKVDFAGSRGLSDEFRLGNYILEREAMSRQDLDLFFGSRGLSTKLCGEQLVMLNYISAEDLRHALSRQTAERIYEVLRWSSGRFGLKAVLEPAFQASQASLQLSVERILMEGFRRIDEWHLIEREIDDFDMVFLRNEEALEQLGVGQLGRDELAVLELVNAKNSVRDIVRQSRMGAFEVSQMLYRLRSIKLIRRRVQPVAV